MTLAAKLEKCIALERKSAEIYRSLGSLFPEAAQFFEELAGKEERHARMLCASGPQKTLSSGERTSQRSLPSIQEGLRIAEHFKRLIETRNITLREASVMAEYFQESLGESYFDTVMSSETDSEIISKLVDIFFEEERHGKMIESFMKGQKFEGPAFR